MVAMLGSLGWPLILGLSACTAFYGAYYQGLLGSEFVYRYFATHPVSYVATAMFFVGLAALLIKTINVVIQYLVLPNIELDVDRSVSLPVDQCGELIDQLEEQPRAARRSYFGTRLREALEYVERKGSADALDDELKYLADMDEARQQDGYALVRIIIWATPMLGFLGTVVGITQALGDLDPKMLATAIQTAMEGLLAGLYVAFDTTALALSLSIVLMFFQFFVDRLETQLLSIVDRRMNEELVGRFETVGGSRDPHLASIHHMAQEVIQSSDKLVVRQTQLWQQALDVAQQQWSTRRTLPAADAECVERGVGAFARRLRRPVVADRTRFGRPGAAKVGAVADGPVQQRADAAVAAAGAGQARRGDGACCGSDGRSHQARNGAQPESQDAVGLAEFRGHRDESGGRHPFAQHTPRRRRCAVAGLIWSRTRRKVVPHETVSQLEERTVRVALSVPSRADLHHGGADRVACAGGTDGARQRFGRCPPNGSGPQPDAQKTTLEDYRWRREMLEQQRAKVQEEIANRRLELSHLEEHIRELEQKWDALRQQATDLQRSLLGETRDRDAAETQLRQLQQQVSEAKQALDDARQEAAQRQPVYAIVPYDGPNGTHRRPIYLECTADGVVIQPEGVVLGWSDFEGPLGPGNPLDAALRAIREYLARLGPPGSQGEPYPLLLVRPTGVESYGLARAAIRSWDDEFGYELIDDQMQLKYPPPDPELARLLQKVIADARSRQQILAAAMPSQYDQQQDVGFVASPTRGGFLPQGPAATEYAQQRKNGFGRGGDARYLDGHAPGTVAGEAPPLDRQSVGGETGKGVPHGKPGAKTGEGCSPLAKSRGRNWGLPGANDRATGIVRPIRIALLPDRLIILPDRGDSVPPELVMIDGSMMNNIDGFVSKIWDRIEQWGIAVAGGYWKPVLHVQVAQGADERFDELRTLLDGSGLEVQRSGQ